MIFISENILTCLNENKFSSLKEKEVACIQSQLQKELNSYEDDDIDDRWFDIRQILRKIQSYIEDGYFIANRDDVKNFMDSFLNDLNYSDKHTYVKGEVVREIGNSIKVYRAIGDKTLFRGVSLDDYNRIKKQGYIDSDMRSAVLTNEGINLAQTPSTALYYLPHDKKGVLLAINPNNLDLYMLKDEYIRVFQPIPFQNIIKVSDPIVKNKQGTVLALNTENKLDQIKTQLKKLNINLNC